MRTLFLAAGMVALAGCNSCLMLPNLTVLGTDCQYLNRKPFVSMAIVGEPFTLDSGLGMSCRRGAPPRASVATVTVTGPDGTKVPHTRAAITHGDYWVNGLEVTFTPERPGAHTVEVSFEPKVGTVKYEIQAAVKRTNPPEQIVAWDGPVDCVGFTFTSQGTLSCMRQVPGDPPRAEVITQRGQTLAGLAFAARGDVLWRITEESGMRVLERRADDGTTFALTHQAVNATATGPMAIIGEDLWLIGSTTTLLKAHPEANGTLTVTSVPRPDVPVFAIGGNAQTLMVWASEAQPIGTRMALLTPEGTGELKRMGGDAFNHQISGVDDDVMWTNYDAWSAEDPSTYRRIAALSPSGSEARAEISPYVELRRADPVFGFFPPRVSIRRDLVHMGQLPREPFVLPTLVSGAIVFELFEVGPGFEQLRSATRSHAFAIAMDQKSVKVISR